MLTDGAAKQAKPEDKHYRLSGRGVYPAVGLSETRARRDEAKMTLRGDSDPSIEMMMKRLANEELTGATVRADNQRLASYLRQRLGHARPKVGAANGEIGQ